MLHMLKGFFKMKLFDIGGVFIMTFQAGQLAADHKPFGDGLFVVFHDLECHVIFPRAVTGFAGNRLLNRDHVRDLFLPETIGRRMTAQAFSALLRIINTELAGKFLFVYQELSQQLHGEIKVRNDILRDAFPAQLNQVNINDGGSVFTLTFTANEGWLNYEFQNLD
jgi:hypothetical protein